MKRGKKRGFFIIAYSYSSIWTSTQFLSFSLSMNLRILTEAASRNNPPPLHHFHIAMQSPSLRLVLVEPGYSREDVTDQVYRKYSRLGKSKRCNFLSLYFIPPLLT